MLRPIACAVMSAAVIAACLTFGLEGLNAFHSDRTSPSDQSGASAKLEKASPQAWDESRRESAPVRVASAVAGANVPDEGVVAISAEARSTHLLSRPLARWNAL